jgi:2-polyprenyl-6-methoxyphenol hydroxylase-like FAD-dependent oxidoreductase
MREGHSEVLVVGAGPVGLWTALRLAEADVEVTIIDRESRTAARSYACALHGNTLRMLQPFGLVTPLLERGRRIHKLAFYNRESCRAQIDLSKSGGQFPFVLIVPQNVLEEELENRLLASGVSVSWNHRFDDYVEEDEQIVATIEELSGTGTGYIVPHWESVVKRRAPLRTQFLIGADGHGSLVRQRLRIEWQHIGKPDVFAAYEFESEESGDDEIRVVLDESSTNVLWPLPNNRLRWTFQLVRSEATDELPEKERRSARLDQPQIDEQIRQYVQRVAAHRAPWFRANVRKIDWCSEVVFEHRVVSHFGCGRCWLAGDAAHQTGPVGVHSMNMGFIEGEKLASLIGGILHDKASAEALQAYDEEQQAVWKQLLGLTGGLQAPAGIDPWLSGQRSRILSCLPGLGGDLASLAGQLGFEIPAQTTPKISAVHG